MAFAQINYSQRLGNGPYTIAEAGCLLTAFANLEARFGVPIDPPTLNNEFLNKRSYIHDPSEPAGTVDDLGWGSISAHDGEVVCVGTGGAGWPDSNDAIIKVQYRGPRTGAIVTHFSLVVDHATGTILDSYDGVVKRNPYGTPVGWAKYERHQPQVVTPPPPPAALPFAIENVEEHEEELKVDTHLWDLNQRSWPGLVNNPAGTASAGTRFTTSQIAHHILGGSYYLPSGSSTQGYNIVDCENPPAPAPAPAAPVAAQTPAPTPAGAAGALRVPGGKPYKLIVAVKGYLTATNAGNHVKEFTELQPGDYYIYNEYPKRSDLINITKKDGEPGAWINTADNVLPPPPAPEPTTAIGSLTEAERQRIALARSPEPVVTAPPVAATPAVGWEQTYVPFPAPVKYVAVRDLVVQDLSAQQPDLTLPKYDGDKPNIGIVSAYGTVTKDGVTFYRLKTSNDPDFKFWYSVPRLDPATKTPLLLALPQTKPKPIGKLTVTRDSLTLSKSKLENELGEFFDILPKWFKNKK